MTINFDKVPKYILKELDPPKKVIKKGARNNRVKQIQEWLNFHQCRTGIDADFSSATQTCIKDFQKKNGLPVKGEVDKSTWKALVKPMKDVLQAPGNITSMTTSEAVLAVANQHVNQHPIEIGGDNCGPWVRLYCEGHDGRQWAWCAGFVTFIMQQAYFYQDLKPPIKGSISCDTLAAQAKKAKLFIRGSDISSGGVKWGKLNTCGIFLSRRTATDWTHTGFAYEGKGLVKELVFSTIEGNTNDEGSREGYEACKRKCSIKKKDFIRFA